MLLKLLQADNLQRGVFRGLKADEGSHSIVKGLLPSRGTDAPVVPGPQAGELKGRHRRGQVIALGLAVTQKGFGHDTADAVLAVVMGVCFTEPVAMPAGHRTASTDLQRLTQNIACCGVNGGRTGHQRACCDGESAQGLAHFGLRRLTNPWGNAVKVIQSCPLDGLGVH